MTTNLALQGMIPGQDTGHMSRKTRNQQTDSIQNTDLLSILQEATEQSTDPKQDRFSDILVALKQTQKQLQPQTSAPLKNKSRNIIKDSAEGKVQIKQADISPLLKADKQKQGAPHPLKSDDSKPSSLNKTPPTESVSKPQKETNQASPNQASVKQISTTPYDFQITSDMRGDEIGLNLLQQSIVSLNGHSFAQDQTDQGGAIHQDPLKGQLTQWINDGKVQIQKTNTPLEMNKPIVVNSGEFNSQLNGEVKNQVMNLGDSKQQTPLQIHTPQNIAPQDVTQQKVVPQVVAAQQASPQIHTPQNGAPQNISQQKIAPQDVAPQQAPPQIHTPHNGAPQDLSQQKIVPQGGMTQNSSAKEPTPQGSPSVPENTPNSRTSEKPQDTTPRSDVPQDTSRPSPLHSVPQPIIRDADKGVQRALDPKVMDKSPLQKVNTIEEGGVGKTLNGQNLAPQTLSEKGGGKIETSLKNMTMAEKVQALQQVKSQMKAALQKGETHMLVKLTPDELGKVDIKLDISRDGAVSVFFKADNRETMILLSKYADDLRQIFGESGLNADASGMNFSSSDQHSSPFEKAAQSIGKNVPMGSENETIIPPSGMIHNIYSGLSGDRRLNITV